MSFTNDNAREVKQIVDKRIPVSAAIKSLKNDTNRMYVLLEDTNHMVRGMLSLLSDSMNNTMRLDDFEQRLADIDAERPLVKYTLGLHSKQLEMLL